MIIPKVRNPKFIETKDGVCKVDKPLRFAVGAKQLSLQDAVTVGVALMHAFDAKQSCYEDCPEIAKEAIDECREAALCVVAEELIDPNDAEAFWAAVNSSPYPVETE